MNRLFLSFFLFFLPAASRAAELTLPHVFGDNMVLQTGQPVAVWGTAEPAQTVTVRFAGQTQTATAEATGRWAVRLAPLPVNATPAELTVTAGAVSRNFANVLVGEVWLCSGQSNMEKPLGTQRGQKPVLNAEEEIRQADFPQIRLLKIPKARANAPAADVNATWTVCSPATIDAIKFSAAGYFFGRKLHQELQVPVGLIDSTWGGTRIEPWTPPSAFASLPSLSALAAAALKPGTKAENTLPGELYHAMIHPLAPFALRGAIWYQGETNLMDIDDSARYADKMTALVQGWRKLWQTELSFYYVQLAPHFYHVVRSATVASPEVEPRFWEAQTAALRIPRTGMIVTTDLVDDLFDIHPRNKQDVGLRLALLALAKDYGRTEVICSGPAFRSLEVQDRRAVLTFDNPGGGLKSKDGKPLTWFTIAGDDGVYFPGVAAIEGEKIAVTSSKVARPVAVRFAWDEAAQPNLCNGAGLPAWPFRTNPAGPSSPPAP